MPEGIEGRRLSLREAFAPFKSPRHYIVVVFFVIFFVVFFAGILVVMVSEGVREGWQGKATEYLTTEEAFWKLVNIKIQCFAKNMFLY